MNYDLTTVDVFKSTTLIKQKRFSEAIDVLKSVEEFADSVTYGMLGMDYFY